MARMMKEQFGLGEGPDVVLEATGAQRCIQTGVHLTKKGGMYVQAGMGREVSWVIVTLSLGYYWITLRAVLTLIRMSSSPSPRPASAT